MMLRKIILIHLIFFCVSSIASACFCFSEPFCEAITDTSFVFKGKVLNFYEAENSFKRFIDLEIVEMISGSDTLSLDTLTYVDYQSSCDLALFLSMEINEFGLFMFENLIDEDEANFPTFNLDMCTTKFLKFSGDSIQGNIAEETSIYDYESFKADVNNLCGMLVHTSNKYELSVNVKVYPNPFNTKLNVEVNTKQSFEYIIYSHSGEIIHFSKNSVKSPQNIDLGDLPKGIYYLQIRMKDEYYMEKFVKT